MQRAISLPVLVLLLGALWLPSEASCQVRGDIKGYATFSDVAYNAGSLFSHVAQIKDSAQAVEAQKLACHPPSLRAPRPLSPEYPLWTEEGKYSADHYRVGSLSKPLVALGILKLQEQGRLKIDDPVAKHLGENTLSNPWEETRPVRIAHLLEHSAGLDDMHFNEYYTFSDTFVPLEQALQRNSHSKQIRWPPGTCSSYSNIGYALAGRIIEVVTDTLFPDWMYENVLRPIGMENSGFDGEKGLPVSPIRGYRWEEEIHPIPTLYSPSMGLVTTADDLKLFASMLLRKGDICGRQVFARASIERMFRSETLPTSNRGWWDGDWGLGWELWYRGGHLLASASGSVDGYLCFVNIAPEKYQANVLVCTEPKSMFHLMDGINREMRPVFKLVVQPGNVKPGSHLDEGTYRLFSTRNSVLDFYVRPYSELIVFREDEAWMGRFPNGETLPLQVDVEDPSLFQVDFGVPVHVIRNEDGVEALYIRGECYVPASSIWGRLVRVVCMSWKWVEITFLVVLVVAMWLNRRVFRAFVPRVAVGVAVLLPYPLYVWGQSILMSEDFAALGTVSTSSVILLGLSILAPLLSFVCPLLGWAVWRAHPGGFVKYSHWPLAVLNLSATIYLFSYGVVPFASWLH